MSHNLFAILFTLAGFITGFSLAMLIRYRQRKNKPSARDILAQELDKFFSNTQRNTLADLRRLNPERCKAIGKGRSVSEMHINFWATAVAGEVGELCNLITKMVRGDNGRFHESIAKEAADIVIYLDLLCTHLDINLEGAIIQKFNEVSDRVNSPLKLNK